VVEHDRHGAARSTSKGCGEVAVYFVLFQPAARRTRRGVRPELPAGEASPFSDKDISNPFTLSAICYKLCSKFTI
jgi:hypothetical protein